MLALVDRIAGFGLRTLVRGAIAVIRPVRRSVGIAGISIRKFGGFRRMAGAGAAIWLSIGSLPAEASEREAVTMVQAGVGTMPLLAAMGIGIVVAALAVIAFLKMTTKARNGSDAEAETLDSMEAFDIEESSAAIQEDNEADSDDLAADLEVSLPDYTVPLPAIRSCPEAAIPAEAGMPRLWGLEGEFAGSGFKVSSCWLTLGRDASQCGLIFPYDAGEISRKHCSLKYEEERGLFLLEDHHSSNGTYLTDGERLEPGIVYELQPGSRFFLSGGRHGFEVQI